MFARERLRNSLAQRICSLPYSKLREFGITRVADVTGLDKVGLPVFTACRPSGEAITISAGKGLTKTDSMAGAVLEGVELWAAETPWRMSQWMYCSYASITSHVIPFDMLQLAHSSPVTVNTPMAFEEMNDVFRCTNIIVPSDMIWLTPRYKPPFILFQSSSSGLAAGVNDADALLQATYEVIERDGWAISEFIQLHTGQWRECISLDCNMHPSLQFCMDHLRRAQVTPFLFDLTRDINVPIFRCTILDDSEYSPGAFSGFGCCLDPISAARRAITEACQARAAYIAGARDDLFRRRFILMKNVDMTTLMGMYNSLPQRRDILSYEEVTFKSVEHEWVTLESLLKDSGITEVYSKTLYSCPDPEFSVLKVICPQMETPLWEHYASGKRAMKALLEVRS